MRWRNRGAVLAASIVLLAGCASTEIDQVLPGAVFKGAAVADEPLAARAAMDMLARGGSAADAVVAAYFTLAVTYPSAASLGGGGVCMVADWDQGQVLALDFVAPRSSAAGGYRATAVPANVRGVAALHARYGYLDWRTVLAPAERIARFGEPLTRASAVTYGAGGRKLLAQPAAREIFAPRGALPVEGQVVIQSDLADFLAALRLGGAGAMYRGPLADNLVQAVQQAGGSLLRQDLWNFKPIWQPVDGVQFHNDNIYFAPAPAGAGLVAGQMWQMLVDDKRYARADIDERYHLLAETARIAFAGRSRWLADDGATLQPGELLSAAAAEQSMTGYNPTAAGVQGGTDNGPPDQSAARVSTGVVAMDYLGGAVACNFTSYKPFGAGIAAPGTGILLAPSPESRDRNPLSLGPVMIFNPRVQAMKFIATGGDGADGATSLINVAAATVIDGQRLDRQIRRPRVHHGGGGTVYLESQADDDILQALTGRGHSVARVKSLGRVNAIHCPPGYPVEPEKTLCWAVSDPRGFGLAVFPD
ncbi:MAG: gamma-glutamyltransferase family protein [Alphaproteobacteria bacterium]|nr:gamma-glutamyltransferase family protein [Alphaproteobacteria bacterium]